MFTLENTALSLNVVWLPTNNLKIPSAKINITRAKRNVSIDSMTEPPALP